MNTYKNLLLKNFNKNTLQKTSNKSFTFKKPLTYPLPIQDKTLQQADPELFDLIEREKQRQWVGLELIASENYTSGPVMEAVGSILTNKYSEGYPAARYYGGNKYIDQIENLCRDRCLDAFKLDKKVWGSNVQTFSGSPANFAVYTAVLQPGDKMMGLHLYSGGHLTHGFKTETKKISASSIYFDSDHYHLNPETSLIDYDAMEKKVKEYKPKLLIVGASAYPRDFDYKRFRQAADSVGALLMADICHIAGLIATGEHNNPFDYADLVTTTTHKSLRGPRHGLIMFNKQRHPDLEEKINTSVFPMLQGGPHNHSMAGVAAQLKEVSSPEFKDYIIQVKKNAKQLAQTLMDAGHKLSSNGTDNHLILWDMKPHGLTGSKMEKGLENVHITLNKNTIQGDKSAVTPGGVRIGTCALTTRGMKENDMKHVGEFLDRFVKTSVDVQAKSGKKLSEFLKALESDKQIEKLSNDVQDFSKQFHIPGVDVTKMKYNH